jgi:hypothetical protein
VRGSRLAGTLHASHTIAHTRRLCSSHCGNDLVVILVKCRLFYKVPAVLLYIGWWRARRERKSHALTCIHHACLPCPAKSIYELELLLYLFRDETKHAPPTPNDSNSKTRKRAEIWLTLEGRHQESRQKQISCAPSLQLPNFQDSMFEFISPKREFCSWFARAAGRGMCSGDSSRGEQKLKQTSCFVLFMRVVRGKKDRGRARSSWSICLPMGCHNVVQVQV